MESFVEKSLLFDFYGELLTEHQQRIFREIVFNDFSAAEVARDEGISRQGVHDLMKRIEKTLVDYEKRLHLVERFLAIRGSVREIQKLTVLPEEAAEDPAEKKKTQQGSRENAELRSRLQQIRAIASSVLEEL